MRRLGAELRVFALVGLVLFGALRLTVRSRILPTRGGKKTIDSVVVIGAYGNSNFGDDLVGVSIVRSLAPKCSHITILGREPDLDGLDATGANRVRYVGGGVKSLLLTAYACRRADLVILGGGGLLEGNPNHVGVHRLVLEYVGKLVYGGLFGARLVVYGVGVSNVGYSNRLVEIAVHRALACASHLSVRDELSQAYLESELSRSVSLIQDPAMCVLTQWAGEIDSAPVPNIVVVLLDRWRWPNFERLDENGEYERREFLADLANRVVRSAQEQGAETIKLVPFHRSDSSVLSDFEEELLAINSSIRTCRLGIEELTYETAFAQVMQSATLYSMRFHPALAGLVAGRDVNLVGDLQKIRQLISLSSADRVGGDRIYPASFGDPRRFLVEAVD